MTFKSYAFFGLSFFQGKPAFLTSVTFNEVYPYDVLQIKEDIYNKKSYNSTGFNIGVSFYKKIVSKISIGIKIKLKNILVMISLKIKKKGYSLYKNI